MQSRFARVTAQLQKELPRWFKMRKDKNSVGAQFLNVFGIQFDDIEDYLNQAFQNMYIDSIDMGQIDILYKATLPSSLTQDDNITLVGEGVKMTAVNSLKEFFNGVAKRKLDTSSLYYSNPYFIDWQKKLVYVRKAYTVTTDYPEGQIELILKDATGAITLDVPIPTQIHHVWNFFDEFGLLLDTPRLYGEKNADYKERILDVFRHPANSTFRGMHNSLARELGLWKTDRWYDGSVDMILKSSNIMQDSIEVDGVLIDPTRIYMDDSERVCLKGDPAFVGKMRMVKYIAGLQLHNFFDQKDLAFQQELYSIDRLATPMLQYYVDIITNQVPILWNQFIWNESFWDIADEQMSGYGYIPSYNDARFLNWKKYNG